MSDRNYHFPFGPREVFTDDIFTSTELLSDKLATVLSEGYRSSLAAGTQQLRVAVSRTGSVPPGHTNGGEIGEGIRRIIYEWRYEGALGGHASGHSSSYNGGFPRREEYRGGDYVSWTAGQACGRIYGHVTVIPFDHDTFRGSTIFDIKQAELVPLPSSPDYVLIGSNSLHPENHFVTPSVQAALRRICRQYRDLAGHPLYLNDASLSMGGLFDIRGRWSPPHYEHRNGTEIDVAATPETMVVEELFLQLVQAENVNYLLEGSGTGRHYHLRF